MTHLQKEEGEETSFTASQMLTGKLHLCQSLVALKTAGEPVAPLLPNEVLFQSDSTSFTRRLPPTKRNAARALLPMAACAREEGEGR